MRKAIDGLAALVEQNFKLSPYENSLLLFCGRRRDRIEALYWQGDGLPIQVKMKFYINETIFVIFQYFASFSDII
jgi:transposase